MTETQHPIAVISVTLNAVAPMMLAFREAPTDIAWRIRHTLDEGLQATVTARGGVDHHGLCRMIGLIERAVDDGAQAVLLTCTVFSPHLATLQRLFPVPIVAADLAMLEAAAKLRRRTAILCTFPASLATSEAMFRAAAAALGLTADVEVALVDGALAALSAGDRARHDDLVAAAARRLAADFQVIVLAQMSMAAVAERLSDVPVPVLTSPACAVAALRAAITHRPTDA
ncbi:hypothetical protein EYW49_07740 [Siculibacillus lacustris]|uniref:Asp/Glu racemase n=1 Tax=Siculibacillus lacustris TaxID=1549641 RepID=A0A4Q9VSP8_9HYPH|nr:aspartate/glutamate racemase family protein [Siculibacillus lacustris]TBW39014.1 hypothetical protein EYW49_07740 [Siculibacillus lacustris]